MTKTKVVIMGGGIGGLSTAHELSKYDNFDITIIERNNYIGGQAADGTTPKLNNHTAICWQTISSTYEYLIDIMDEITDEEDIKVIAHLRPLDKFIYAFNDKNRKEYTNPFISYDFVDMFSGRSSNIEKSIKRLYGVDITKKDLLKLYLIYFYANSLCDEHLEKYDKMLWCDYIEDISPILKKWILDSISIYLGMEYDKISVYFVFNLLRKISTSSKLDENHTLYSFDGSMNSVLFAPWKRHLKHKGVKFLLNHEILEIYRTPQLLTISTIKIKNDDEITNQTADVFVNAMDIKNLAKLYPNDIIDKVSFLELYENSKQIQTQVIYYLPYRLQPLYNKPTILVIPDSPWLLTIRIEGELWELYESDILSCRIGIWNKPGQNGKCAINCSRKEIAQECWNQINAAKHNLKLSTKLPKWNIWKDFKFNEIIGEIETSEPKLSNNINTLTLRPELRDVNIANLYHATTYARTKTNVYNMESAAEAGVKVANIIVNKTDPMHPVMNKKCKKTKKIKWYFRFARFLDKLFFS